MTETKDGLEPKPHIRHEFKKTLAKSGMYFIDMCHTCGETRPHLSWSQASEYNNIDLKQFYKRLDKELNQS